MLHRLFTAVCQKHQRSLVVICAVPTITRIQQAPARRKNERCVRQHIIVQKLASRNTERLVLRDLEHELRALDQSRFTTDGMNHVFQERVSEPEIVLFETRVLNAEEATKARAIFTFEPPDLETRLGFKPCGALVTKNRGQM